MKADRFIGIVFVSVGSLVGVASLFVACGGKSAGASGSSSGGQVSSSGSAGSSSGTQDASPSSFGTPAPVEQHVLNPPVVLASDGTHLFWIDAQGGLWKDPVAGGSPTQIATEADGRFLSLDSTNVYFVGGGGFASVPKQAGTVTTPTTLITATSITSASVTGQTVYWVEMDDTGSGLPKVTVKSAPLVAGGTVTTLGTLPRPEPPLAIAAVGSTIFLAGPGTQPGILQDDGGAPAPISALACTALLAGTDGVYCAGSPFAFVGLDGTTTTQIAAETNNATHLALDTTNVYWTNQATSGSVVTAPRNGGANINIAYDDTPIAVAVDDAAVYWSDNAGNLQRAAKQW